MICLLASLGPLTGCYRNDGPARYHVSGTVTFQGKPVPFGEIMFVPDLSKGNQGPAGFARIKDGQFNTAVDGKGTTGGAQQVVINGSPVSLERNTDDPITPLFNEYRVEAVLPQSTTTLNFEVPE